jgi:hypothetical protein
VQIDGLPPEEDLPARAVPLEHGAGEFTLTQEQIGSRYVFVIIRTLIDANDPADIKAANALQDKIAVRQANAGKFEIPDWDEVSLKKVRDAINVLAATRTSAKDTYEEFVAAGLSQFKKLPLGWKEATTPPLTSPPLPALGAPTQPQNVRRVCS